MLTPDRSATSLIRRYSECIMCNIPPGADSRGKQGISGFAKLQQMGMHSMRKARVAVALLTLFACAKEEPALAIATTTSLDGSGLLQQLRVAFKRDTGILLEAFVVGSGRALDMAARGKVVVTITHDPE